MTDQDLAQLPINEFLSSNGLVCVWCTNSQNHIDSLKSIIFPIWNVKYVACWYWIKVLSFDNLLQKNDIVLLCLSPRKYIQIKIIDTVI